MNRAECLIFIMNNVLGYLQWQMKRSAYLVYNADLDDEMYEEDQAVNAVYD